MQLAPWLKSTDTLGAINSGSSAGLAIRAAIERERAQRAEEAMAQDRAAQAEQSAAEKLKFDYDRMGLDSVLRERDRADRLKESEANRAVTKGHYDSIAADRVADNKTAAQKLLDAENLRTLEQRDTAELAAEVSKGTDALKAISMFPHSTPAFAHNLMQDYLLAKRQETADKKAESAADLVSTSYKIPAIEGVEGRPAGRNPWTFGITTRPERLAVPEQPEITVHDKVSRAAIEKLRSPSQNTPLTPIQKVEKAKALSRSNPELTKEEIIRMVEGE